MLQSINVQQILEDYQQKQDTLQPVKRVFIFIFYLLLALWILNFIVGLVLYTLNLSSNLLWHSSSVLVIALYLIGFVVKILCHYSRFSDQGAYFATYFSAQKVTLSSQNIEHQIVYQINQKVAKQFSCQAFDLYMIDDQGINSFSFGLTSHHSMIFLTWGMLYHFTPQELYRMLIWHYVMILSGETQQRSLYFIYLQGYLLYRTDLALYHLIKRLKNHYDFYTSLKLYGVSIIQILSRVDQILHHYTTQHLFKNIDLDDCFAQHDREYINLLLRADLHDRQIVQYDRISLSPLAWIPSYHGIYGTTKAMLKGRITKINQQPYPLSEAYRYVYHDFRYLKDSILKFNYAKNQRIWQSPLPLPNIADEIQPLLMDHMRPLNPQLRQKQAEQHLKKIFATTQHYLHIVSFIFEMRKHHKIDIHQNTEMSGTVWSILHKIDQRLLFEIFEQCYQKIALPLVVIEPYLYQWAQIIQSDGKIHILDALMLERLKAKWQLLTPATPQQLTPALVQDIVQLVEAILLVQPFDIPIEVKQRAFVYVFGDLYQIQAIQQQIDYDLLFRKIMGLNIKDRLTILGLIEYLLHYHQKITQDVFDIFVLLHWRLGFESEVLKQHLYKRHQITIW